jgi:hypothetical protein
MNTYITQKHSVLAFLLHLSVAIATDISLATHTTCFTEPYSQCDVGPLWAGLTIAYHVCHP